MRHTVDVKDAARACRQILQHLDEPSVLATNLLLRDHHHDAAQLTPYLRSTLRTLALQLGERERAILLRCDLGGEPHKKAACALGLSMRQFYRERAAMTSRLAAMLTEQFRDGGARAAAIDVAGLELARATAMQHGGQRSMALRLLQSIVASNAAPDVRLAARCERLTMLTEESAFACAYAELAALDADRAQAGDASALVEARVNYARWYLLWCGGHDADARKLADRGVEPFVLSSGVQGRVSKEFAASALTMLARQAFICGRFQDAWARLERAHDILALLHDPPVWTRIEALVLTGVFYAVMRTSGQHVPAELPEAAALAVQHGLSELVVIAAMGVSMDEQMRRNHASALARMQNLLSLAREAASRLNFAHVCLHLAQLQAESGDGDAALRLLADARDAFPVRNYAWTYNNVVASMAYAALHDFLRARQAATEAACAARSQGNASVEGIALLALAKSLVGLNARSEAVDVAHSAIDRLETHGYPAHLLGAYELAALLTGRRHFTERARELRRMIEFGATAAIMPS